MMPEPYTLEWWVAKATALDVLIDNLDREAIDKDGKMTLKAVDTYSQLILAADKAAEWVETLKEREGHRCPNCNTEFGVDSDNQFPMGGDHDE